MENGQLDSIGKIWAYEELSVADWRTPRILDDTLDAETGELLVWCGRTPDGE